MSQEVIPEEDLENSTVCEDCGKRYWVGQWYKCPHLPLGSGRFALGFDAVVFHEDAEGHIRFPASPDAPLPEGFVKKELRSIGEVRAFQKRVEGIERGKINKHVEAECAWIEHVESQLRPELRQQMQRMTPAQRAFAELAIATNNARRPKSFDPGFFIEPFEMNSTNREAWCDERTQWQRRQK